jgi:hypothetical protein
MYSRRRNAASRLILAALLIGESLFISGCGRESGDKAEERLMKLNGQQPLTLAKFAGKVTIDGQVPEVDAEHPLHVILYNLKEPPTLERPPIATICEPDGSFQFGTRKRGDGVPQGEYVVLFAELKHARLASYREPDSLNNLYNDPDKNQETPEFKVDLKPPGKTDCVFELKVSGKPPVSTPGPKAIVQLGFVKKK